MCSAAAQGRLVDRGQGPFCLSEMRAWKEDRIVDGEVLRSLLVDSKWPVSAKGVQLRGIRIIGHLDLEASELRCPLRLVSCYLDGEPPALGFAKVPLMELNNCYLAGLAAESLVVSTDMNLNGSTFDGPICLQGSDIAGQLNLGGATLKGADQDGDSLVADGLKVGGDLILNNGFTAEGAVLLLGANIAGQLNFCGATLNGTEKDGSALVADTISIGGDAFLSQGFSVAGAIRLPAANIVSKLDFSDAQLIGKDNDGYALIGFRMRVGTDVLLDRMHTAKGAIKLQGADITGQLSCRGAQLNGKDVEGNTLIADSMKVGGRLIIDDGFEAAGAIRFPGASVTGRFRCQHAELNGKDKHGNALLADGMNVGGGVILGDVRVSSGGIRLVGAEIAGDLQCDRLRLESATDDGYAFIADSVRVSDGLMLYGLQTAAGGIRLPGANIAGRLRFGGGDLKGTDKGRRAVLMDGIRVGGGAWVGGIRMTDGAFRIVGAEISGDLRCEGVRLKGADRDGRSLIADRIKVSGSIFLTSESPDYGNGQSVAKGAISLRSASIGGSLQLDPEKLAGHSNAGANTSVALDLTGAQLAHDLEWKPHRAVLGEVILEDAQVGQLKDNLQVRNGHWPSACDGLLRLDGFTYARIYEQPGVTLDKRLEWIGSPRKPSRGKRPMFTTQPYEQLAQAYRQAGRDTEARRVAIARRRDLRRYGDLTIYRRLGNWLLDNSIRYGYRTWRAVAALATLYAVAFVIFLIAQHHTGWLIPVLAPTGMHPLPSASHCTSSYACFYPAGYAIDTVIPLVNVHQSTYWLPNGHAPWGHALVIFTWVSTILGWALATLAVAGYTGLVRQD
jgi:hypothetical protein